MHFSSFPGGCAVRGHRASPTRALPTFSLSISLLRALFQARLPCLAVALSLFRSPGWLARSRSLSLSPSLSLYFERARALCLPVFLSRLLALVGAQFLSLFFSLSFSNILSFVFSFSLSLCFCLFLPPVLSLASFSKRCTRQRSAQKDIQEKTASPARRTSIRTIAASRAT